LTSALEGCEWLASRLGRFAPREIAPGTHWIGGWVGPRADLENLYEEGARMKVVELLKWMKIETVHS